jgi:protein TonB
MRRIPATSSLTLLPPPALAPAARRWLTLAVVGAHGALAVGLLQASPRPAPRADAPVLTVDLLAPPAPPVPAAAPLPPVPVVVPRPVAVRAAAPVSRQIVAAPAPEPAPTAVVAEAAPPAPAASAPAAVAVPAESAVTVVVAPAAAAPAAPAPVHELPPSSISYRDPPVPVYPRASRRAGEAGLVVVRVFVDAAGLPRAVQLAQSSGHARLDAAATDAVLRSRFHPPTDQGRPTAGWARIPIPFELETLP